MELWTAHTRDRVLKVFNMYGFGRWGRMTTPEGGLHEMKVIEDFSRLFVLQCGLIASEQELGKQDSDFVKDAINSAKYLEAMIRSGHLEMPSSLLEEKFLQKMKMGLAKKTLNKLDALSKLVHIMRITCDRAFREQGVIVDVNMNIDDVVSALNTEQIIRHIPLGDVRPAWTRLSDWWDLECDMHLVLGIFRHGYGRYDLIKEDPSLMFIRKLNTRLGNDTTQLTSSSRASLSEESRATPLLQMEADEATAQEDAEPPLVAAVAGSKVFHWPISRILNRLFVWLVSSETARLTKAQILQQQREVRDQKKEDRKREIFTNASTPPTKVPRPEPWQSEDRESCTEAQLLLNAYELLDVEAIALLYKPAIQGMKKCESIVQLPFSDDGEGSPDEAVFTDEEAIRLSCALVLFGAPSALKDDVGTACDEGDLQSCTPELTQQLMAFVAARDFSGVWAILRSLHWKSIWSTSAHIFVAEWALAEKGDAFDFPRSRQPRVVDLSKITHRVDYFLDEEELFTYLRAHGGAVRKEIGEGTVDGSYTAASSSSAAMKSSPQSTSHELCSEAGNDEVENEELTKGETGDTTAQPDFPSTKSHTLREMNWETIPHAQVITESMGIEYSDSADHALYSWRDLLERCKITKTLAQLQFFYQKIWLPFVRALSLCKNGLSQHNQKLVIPNPLSPLLDHHLAARGLCHMFILRQHLLTAAHRVLSRHREPLLSYLKSQPGRFFLEGMPVWWCPWIHDVGLLVGLLKHGFLSLPCLTKDPTLPFTSEYLDKHIRQTFLYGSAHVVPAALGEVDSAEEAEALVAALCMQFPDSRDLELRVMRILGDVTRELVGTDDTVPLVRCFSMFYSSTSPCIPVDNAAETSSRPGKDHGQESTESEVRNDDQRCPAVPLGRIARETKQNRFIASL